MDWWLLSFFVGAILSLFLPIVPEFFTLLLFISLGIASCLYKKLRITSGLFFGIVWLLYNGFQYENIWQENGINIIEFAQQAQNIEGEVISIPSEKDNNFRFNFKVSKLNHQKIIQPFILRLRWKINKNTADFNLEQGQVYQLTVKFKPAHGFANEGGFNYQKWLREKHIVGTGYVKPSSDNVLIDSNANVRHTLYQQYLQQLPQNPLSGLLLALSFAQRNEISPKLWQVLQATGTQHLIAISGLHLGLVATGSFILLLMFFSYLPLSYCLSKLHQQQLMQLNLKYLVIFLSLAITLFYGYLADFSIPTSRALTMLMLYWLMRVMGIKFSLVRWLLITLFLLVLFDPFSLFSASFWLSFYAVTIIFLTLWRFSSVLSHSSTSIRFLKGLLIIQLSLTIFLLPLTALFYQQISIVSLLANLVAVPVMSLLIIPLCLLSLLILPLSSYLSTAVMNLALEVLQGLWGYLVFLAEQPLALIPISVTNAQMMSVIIGVIAVYCFCSFKCFNGFSKVTKLSLPKIKTYLTLPSVKKIKEQQTVGKKFKEHSNHTTKVIKGSVFFACLLIPYWLFVKGSDDSEPHVNHSLVTPTVNWQVIVLDVGHGLAIIILRDKHAILYDTGGSYPSGFNIVDAVVLPFLKYQGIHKLDKVIISHSDNDHAGGLSILRAGIMINEVVVNDPTIRNKGDGYCLAGQSFDWQGLHFNQLWPPDEVKGSDNDDSCVIRISDGQQSVLLTGDISDKIEKHLVLTSQISNNVSPEPIALDSDILLAAHHGSKTSSTSDFIDAVSPSAVIFSAGYLNHWKMPNKAVIQRFTQANIPTYTTSEVGMIKIDFNNNSANIFKYRHDLSPYWFAN